MATHDVMNRARRALHRLNSFLKDWDDIDEHQLRHFLHENNPNPECLKEARARFTSSQKQLGSKGAVRPDMSDMPADVPHQKVVSPDVQRKRHFKSV